MKTTLETAALALSTLPASTTLTAVMAIVNACPQLTAALAGATVEAQRDAVVTISKEVRSTGGQTTGWT
ncbi:hypothetical protein QCE62_00210 [Caballeronia sp. LZ033]|uniref:hypothetical protein n=1 Tax=Caballeronia sp. LZ033 TaxID=3038566 RepID=UPI00285F3719|nr:hypothetical protein [Caballeronia sp. LZ033]MDR5812010.1 hypothetical protein [Caballeronia sp. LZ033]